MDSFRIFVLDQLRDLGGVSARSMFGGVGLYRAGAMFGIIYRDRLYLKTDDASREDFVARGTAVLQVSERQILKRYYEVPADILEDPAALAEWAGRACAAG